MMNRFTTSIQGKWRCVGLGEKGTVFEDVQIPEGEWYDYDEKVRPR